MLAPRLPADVFDDPLCRRFVLPGFHSHLHSLMVTMSLKSSATQSTYSVPWGLMSDTRIWPLQLKDYFGAGLYHRFNMLRDANLKPLALQWIFG